MSAPRTINAYVAFEPSGNIIPYQYKSRPLGSEDVEIKISHCGICASDVHHLSRDRRSTIYPCVAGHEIIGEVTVADPSVKNLAVGDRFGVGAHV
ncbi:hypothetical protein PC116_g28802 [Phytophthora cactorum]|uniref:Alcohol dehydrogenase-like N-terminal domain-containing protein n=1 Tax=Phytophthora cactorum TaxID=29920 RepID=A0A8T1B5V4_9STRA|nr:hypothetical protein PC114_g26894 [Phytophthora cactorum]KAG2894780.1 hypothetical protein PC117_g23399 [Phytophthora cactorum]KAG2959679.1 hypothetical protein PC119_g26635 [Phytophthora cactorum]KAG3131756.1 hypothetical protein PC128_g26563 [Phytophthora cactorum]KAG4222725.1 hypothetical protein PC116_g28802 [Phytophthora cactorum]